MKKLEITGVEANLLLFAFDSYFRVDVMGQVPWPHGRHGCTREQMQDLRDRLMAAHEHPPSKRQSNAK